MLLDFFTYCCINCLHILPTLEDIEKSCANGAVSIVGVHSAKFENEKLFSNVKNAVKRYEIGHPVVCDDGDLWEKLNISCWPTVALLAPGRRVIFMLIGENYVIKWARLLCEELARFFLENEQLFTVKLDELDASQVTAAAKQHRALSFPGKVSLSPSALHIVVSDSGNHRLLVASIDGEVEHTIGSGSRGFRDGSFDNAAFNAPQGTAWASDTLLYVADTGNHAVREIDLVSRTVKTIAGDGAQGSDVVGGRQSRDQSLNSPWDLCLVGDDKLFIAMAGSHQVDAQLDAQPEHHSRGC